MKSWKRQAIEEAIDRAHKRRSGCNPTIWEVARACYEAGWEDASYMWHCQACGVPIRQGYGKTYTVDSRIAVACEDCYRERQPDL